MIGLAVAFALLFDNPMELFSATVKFIDQFDRASPWFIAAGFLFLVGGGLICFPVTVSIAVVALTYEPLTAFALIMAGCLTSAAAGHAIGKRIDLNRLPFVRRSATEAVQKYVDRHGVQSSLLLRFVPIAPFTIVNFTLGFVNVRLPHFLLGCFLGLLPGAIIFTWFGVSLRHFIENPKFGIVGIGAAIAILVWIAVPYLHKRLSASREV